MDQEETYQTVCSELEYRRGIIKDVEQAHTPVQRHLFSEAKRLIKNIDAMYFSGDVPIAYFKLLSDFDETEIIELHRRVWNQSRIPFLYVITPGELRIYNCFEEPANPEIEDLDAQERLIEHFDIAAGILEGLKKFSKSQIDSGAFWKSEEGQRFRSDRMVDQRLLKHLRITREKLHDHGLEYSVIHNLLGRSIFILYLEDRGAIDKDIFYDQFLNGATTYSDVIKDKSAVYRLFEKLKEEFNGDLFPVTDEERNSNVNSTHLKFIRELFYGTDMDTGQQTLWRPYDFGVIPIELISAIYEKFLHKEKEKGYLSKEGAYYTPHALVEFVLNEVLPWPSDDDHQHELSILDPACGSGIFLVEAFRRLVARWKFSHNEKNIPILELERILTNCIYGVDINEDAIRVAAFSLYLAFMDYLEPKRIEQIRFPYLVYHPDDPDKYGKNLFPMDIFETVPFENTNYDIVVGNPPWKRDGLPEHISNYLSSRGFAQEIAQAFLWRVRDFSSNGKIVLLATSKILFNTETKDCHFRREFFGKNYIETVVNFSALRRTKGKKGRQLFVSAVGPATVFFYRTNAPKQPRSTILYCTPKPTRADNALPGITIDASEFKFLPRIKCSTSDRIWKVAMWGTQRDLEIIERLQKHDNLASHFGSCKSDLLWKEAHGFQTSSSHNKNKPDDRLSNMPFIDAKDVTRFQINPDKITKVKPNAFFRFGCMETYFGPHILIKEGQANKKFCAAFTEHDCAFRKTITGVSGPSDESALMKAITVYLNSSFSSYFLFLTASTWGVERESVYSNEVFQLPDLPFRFTDEQIDKLAGNVDAIGKLMADGLHETDARICKIETDIDQIIYESLDLSKSERFLVDDVLEYGLDFFQEGENSKACDIVDTEDLEAYSETFCDAVNSILQFGESRAAAMVYRGDAPLRVVSIRFSEVNDKRTVTISDSTDELENVLSRLDRQIIEEYSGSIYVRRNVKFYDKDTLYITKPAEKRFWTRSMALSDADETLAEGLGRSS